MMYPLGSDKTAVFVDLLVAETITGAQCLHANQAARSYFNVELSVAKVMEKPHYEEIF